MKLIPEQIEFYNKNGYLVIENFLSTREVDLLNAELPKTIENDSPRVILEKSGHVRSVFAPHFSNKIYNKLGRLKGFIDIAEQLLSNKVYIHQYKINCKKGLQSEWWEWHQDFPYWHLDDGIEHPDLLNIMIYMQDTDSLNGALLLIPASHNDGIAKFADKDTVSLLKSLDESDRNKDKNHLSSLNSNIKFTVDHELLRTLAFSNSIITASGKKGTILMFHPNIFHASNNNMTPFDRNMVLITYNSINNFPRINADARPDFLAGRDREPIENTVSSLFD